MSTAKLEPMRSDPQTPYTRREQIFDAFRRWGFLQADLDPLGQYLQPLSVPELDDTSDIAAEARRCYCGTVGAEFMHIDFPERRRWIQERLEGSPTATDQKLILELLT